MSLIAKYLRPGVITSTCWIIALFVLMYNRTRWRPQECTTIEDVSPFYGPGAYWAWVLTTISALCSTLSMDRNGVVSLDFIGPFLYAFASMADYQLRICADCQYQGDFQLKASLQIVAVSSLFCFLTLCIGEGWHNGDRTILTLDQWQLWKSLLLAPYFQVTIWILWVMSDTIVGLVGIFFICYVALPGLWVQNREDGFTRGFRYFLLYAFVIIYVVHEQPVGRLSALPLVPPLSGSKLSDVDQILTLSVATLVILVQWKAWRCIPSLASQRMKENKRTVLTRDD